MTGLSLLAAFLAGRGLVAFVGDVWRGFCWLTNRCPGCGKKHDAEGEA